MSGTFWNWKKYVWQTSAYILFLFICIDVNKKLETIDDLPGILESSYDFLSSRPLANLSVVVMMVMGALGCLWNSFRKKYLDLDLLYVLLLAITLLAVFDAWEYVSVPLLKPFDYRWLGITILGLSSLAILALQIPFVSNLIRRIKFDVSESSQSSEGVSSSFEASSKPSEYLDTEWDDFLDNLINRIKTADTSQESFAVGITGTWGEGKTRMLSMIKDNLESEYVFEFNPWKNSDNISMNFMNELASSLSDLIPVGNTLHKYARMLKEYDVHPISNAVASLLLSSHDSSLHRQSQKVSDCLDRLGSNLYVIVDDLDRLDSGELLEVLKLIRNTASFRHVVYIVAYDKQYVTDLLGSLNISKPEEYLRKIFPLQISLPKLPYGFLADFLDKELRRLLPDDSRISNAELSDLISEKDNQYEFIIEHYLLNLRDVKNFAMSFVAAYETLAGNPRWIQEYNLHDFFWLEVMHFSEQDLYNKLRDSRFLLRLAINSNPPVYYLRTDVDEYNELSHRQKKLLDMVFLNDGDSSGRLANYYDYSKYFQIRIPKHDMPYFDFAGMLEGTIDIADYLRRRLSEGLFPTRSLAHYMKRQDTSSEKIAPEMLKRYVDILVDWAVLDWQGDDVAQIIATKVPIHDDDLMRYFISRLRAWILEAGVLDKRSAKLKSYIQIQYFIRAIYRKYKTAEIKKGGTFSSMTDSDGLPSLINENYMSFAESLPLDKPTSILSRRARLFLKCSTVEYQTGTKYNQSPIYGYDNLVIDRLIKKFSASPSLEYEQVLNAFSYNPLASSVNIRQSLSEQNNNLRMGVLNEITKLFGSTDLYKEFLEKCFTIPPDRLVEYYGYLAI